MFLTILYTFLHGIIALWSWMIHRKINFETKWYTVILVATLVIANHLISWASLLYMLSFLFGKHLKLPFKIVFLAYLEIMIPSPPPPSGGCGVKQKHTLWSYLAYGEPKCEFLAGVDKHYDIQILLLPNCTVQQKLSSQNKNNICR